MTPEWAQVFVRVGQTMVIAWGIWLMRSSNQEWQATAEMLREEAALLREQRTTLHEQTTTQNAHTDALRRLLEDKSP